MGNNINIDVILEIEKAKKDIQKLENEFKNLNKSINNKNINEFEKGLKNTSKSGTELIGTLTKIGGIIGAGAIFKAGIESVAEFEASISKLGAISGATTNELEKMKEKALELGRKTQYSSSQVAEGMNYLAMAGLKTNDILKSTADVLNLATIGQMDLAQASDISSNILSGFGLSAEEMKRVVDVMTATITNANTNISQLGEAMKYVAPQAKAMGVSIEETATAIGVLSNAGLQGSLAGTGLAQVLSRLSAPTGKAKEDLEKLGIQVYDSQGKFLGLQNVLTQFNEKLKTLSQEDKAKYIQEIFGQEAMKSVLVLVDEVDKSYTKLNEKIKDSAGLSSEISAQMRDNLKGAWQELMSALDGLAQSIGQDLLPALTNFVKFLTDGVSSITDFYEENKVLIKTITELGVVFTTLNGIAKASIILGNASIVTRIGAIITGVGSLSEAIGLLKTALMGLVATNPILAGLGLALAGVTYYINDLEESTAKLNKVTNELNEATKNVGNIIEEVYGKHFNKATQQLELTNEEQKKYKATIDDLIETTRKQIEEIKKNNDGSLEYKNTIAELEKKLKILQEAQSGVNNAKIIEDQKKATEETKTQTKAVKELTDEQKKLLDEIDKQLAREQKKNESIDDWYKHQKDTIDKVLSGTKEYYEAVEKLNNTYYEKLKTNYDKRVEDHEKVVKTLEEKEKDLTDKIVKLNEDLQNKLKKLEQDRLNTIENIEDKIHNIQTSGLSDYEKYVDKKKQAEVKLAKAKEELEKGNLEQAKKYMGQYESLVTSLANTEIKENGKVKVSKEESNKIAVNGLKELEKLTNDYYGKEKQKAIELHNQKIAQLKAQLTATKSQLELEVQRLNLEKQMIELLTGQKVDIDTSSALNSIKNLDKQIKELDTQIKNPKDVVISANDTSVTQAKQNIQGIPKQITLDVMADYTQTEQQLNEKINEFESNPIETKITADDEEAKHTFLEVRDYVTGEEVRFDLNAKDEKAKDTFLKVKDTITGEEISFNLSADNEKAIKKLEDVKTKAKNLKPLVDVVADTSEAMSKINSIPKVIVTKHIIKTIEEHNAGGIVGGIHKFATGGEVKENEFKRVQGRIAGYDPSDSDDVPALLTRGEFVVKREAVKHYGDDFLYRLNNKQLPKFATGGKVDDNEISFLKEKIKGISSSLGITLEDKVLNSNDKNRLESYANKLENLKVPSVEEIESKYSNYVTNKINEQRKYRYSQTGMFWAGTTLDKTQSYTPKPSEFLQSIGVKHTDKIPLQMNYDFRSFGNKYQLSEDKAIQIQKELLKENLPKFATGGLVEIGEVTRQKIDTSSNTFNSFDKLNIDTSSIESAIDKVRKYFDELGVNVGVVNGYVLKGNSTNISTGTGGGAGSVRVNNGNKKNIKITDNELNSIINETKQDYTQATNVIKEAERQENSYNSKVKQYEKIVESQKETIKSEDEAKKTEDKLKSLESQIKRISDYVDRTLNKKIEESAKKLENDSEKFSDYFNRLEEEKNNIESKISSSGYSDELIAKISKKYFKTELKNDYKDNYNLSELKQKYEPILDKTINYLDEVTKTKEDISNEIDSSGYDKNLIFKLSGLQDNYEDSFDINYLQNYKVKIKQTIGQISEANSIREQIEAILSNKNIDKSLIDNNYLDSYNISRLNRFKNNLNNISLLSEDKIKNRYKAVVEDYLRKWRSVYHSQAGMNEAYVMMNKNRTRPPSGSSFVYNLGIKHDRDLAKRYDNLFKSIDPRVYGESYDLGSEIINTTKKDYLKEHLPKFQNGGIIALQNGGKLDGYGGGDRNLALLEDGEFVIRKEAVKNYGAEFLHSLNSIKLPKFQFGGMVDFNNLPKFNTGGEVSSGYTANINFTMPSGKSYEFNGNESAVKAFSQELRRVL